MLQIMLPLSTVCAVLLLAVNFSHSTTADLVPTCAKDCKCLGPWANCINGNLEDVPGHFGPQIETMSIQSYNITVIEANTFSGLKIPNLWKLDILNCDVVTIKKNAFSGLQELVSLHLDNNKIEVIEAGAFNGVSKLNSLSFQHNKLKTLELGMFEGLVNLNSLNLNDNLLKSLKPNVFVKARSLTTILVKENMIETIGRSALEGLNKSARFYVGKNPLVCNCTLKKEWPVLRDRIMGATCGSPSNLAGNSLDVLQSLNCDYSEGN
jgi:Leucine-rich repeat (LRR) protein